MNKRLKPIVTTGVSILLGFALGVSYTRYYEPKPPPEFRGPEHRGRRFLEHFAGQLNLTKEQKQKAHEIFEAQRQKMDSLRKATFPRFHEIREETRKAVRQVLTPEQQKRFDKLHQKLEKRRRKFFGKRHRRNGRRRGHGPPHGPPPMGPPGFEHGPPPGHEPPPEEGL